MKMLKGRDWEFADNGENGSDPEVDFEKEKRSKPRERDGEHITERIFFYRDRKFVFGGENMCWKYATIRFGWVGTYVAIQLYIK